MILIAALCFGVFAYAAAGILLGLPVRLRPVPGRRTTGDRAAARRAWLAQAGVGVTPTQFWVASVGVGAAAFALGAVVTGAPVVALVPALAATASTS